MASSCASCMLITPLPFMHYGAKMLYHNLQLFSLSTRRVYLSTKYHANNYRMVLDASANWLSSIYRSVRLIDTHRTCVCLSQITQTISLSECLALSRNTELETRVFFSFFFGNSFLSHPLSDAIRSRVCVSRSARSLAADRKDFSHDGRFCFSFAEETSRGCT